jgi:hypothetical protein
MAISTIDATGLTNSLTLVYDVTINGLTVGKGGGAVSTNTAVGASALTNNSTGARNTAFGDLALNSNTTTTYSDATAIGYNALYQGGGGKSTAVGSGALSSENGSGGTNVAVGYNALTSDTSGGQNVAVGVQALQANTTAVYNTAVGYQAGYTNTTGLYNNSVGAQALYTNSTANENNAFGFQTLKLTTGLGNTAMGSQAGLNVSTGTLNSFFGYGAGSAITTGSKNTIIGAYGGNQGGLDIRTASNYIVLSDGDGNPRGYFDNNGVFVTGQSTAISSGITMTNVYGITSYRTSNNANYGIHSFYSDYGSTQSQRAYFSGNGGLANYSANNANLSDERMKKDITLAGNYLDKVCAIPVKTFIYKDQQDTSLNLGVIAQDVQAVAPELVCLDGFGETKAEDGSELLSIYETDLMYALMKSIQELKTIVNTQAATIATQTEQIAALQSKIGT